MHWRPAFQATTSSSMLRFMKNKVQEEVMESASNTRTTGITNQNRQNIKVVLSHVPISVGSKSGNTSTNSSISSNQDENIEMSHDTIKPSIISSPSSPQVPIIGDEDSRKESLSSPNASSPDITLEAKHFTPTAAPAKRFRKISDAEVSLPPPKKARLAHPKKIPSSPLPSPSTLLSMKKDEMILSPIHVFIRSQIEVFVATAKELSQPAPGRKQPIKPYQVGLRCIHCRHLPSRERVKRAACYPSSVARVYHSVSDMKFDHFSNCRNLPPDLRTKFEALKAEGQKTGDKGKSFSSSTARYYRDTALQMGMIDGPGGIFLDNKALVTPLSSSLGNSLDMTTLESAPRPPFMYGSAELSALTRSVSDNLINNSSRSNGSVQMLPTSTGQLRIKLAEESDSEHLNALHCFVRKNIEFFAADSNDIAAPAPGRKSRIAMGQVGIRCVHCANLPTKDRVKRAVCYPPNITGIYHSVSNMKFDHFAICKGLPPKEREEFTALKTSNAVRSKFGSSGPSGLPSSMAEYYCKSATCKGLIDTGTGIRFASRVVKADEKSTLPPAEIPTGISILIKAISQQAV